MLRPEQPVTRRDTMTIARKLLPLAALLLALGPASPPARAAAPDYQALNAALVEDYVVSRYQAFAHATAALDAAIVEACADKRPTPDEAGDAYHAAMDADRKSVG